MGVCVGLDVGVGVKVGVDGRVWVRTFGSRCASKVSVDVTISARLITSSIYVVGL